MVDVTLMMLPPPECSSISGTAAEVSACAVETLNVNASLRSFVEVLPSGAGMVPATLFTTMSSLPNASTALPASLAVSSGCARSATTISARRPVARICSATSSSWDCVRDAMTTSAPASANASAIAAPSPRPAPVTTATWLSSRNLSRITCVFLPSPGETVAGVGSVRDVFLKHVLVFSGTPYLHPNAKSSIVDAAESGLLLRRGLRGRCLLRRRLLRRLVTVVGTAASAARLHAGLQLGQQVRHVLG